MVWMYRRVFHFLLYDLEPRFIHVSQNKISVGVCSLEAAKILVWRILMYLLEIQLTSRNSLMLRGIPFLFQTTRLLCSVGIILTKNRILWKASIMNSFLIVAKTPELPRFTPSFIDYGYNRMEWVAHLRYAGYRFSVLSQAWGFHLRHEKLQTFSDNDV